jgi:hypothetical protein
MPLICLRLDATGTRPVMLHDRDELSCADGVEWRFVASVPDADHGRRLLDQLRYEHEQHLAAAGVALSLLDRNSNPLAAARQGMPAARGRTGRS